MEKKGRKRQKKPSQSTKRDFTEKGFHNPSDRQCFKNFYKPPLSRYAQECFITPIKTEEKREKLKSNETKLNKVYLKKKLYMKPIVYLTSKIMAS